MRIAIVTQYFPPDPPPSWIPSDIAQELAERGHEVRVLTTFPHYETGRVAPGYRQRFHHVEHVGQVTVRRVPCFASHSSNPVSRVLNYMSVAASMRLARSFVKGTDVAYVYATPMTVADPTRVWARSLKLPFVLHVQDLWPESVTGSGFVSAGIAKLMRVPLDWWLKRVYRRASTTIAIAPTMQKMLIERGVPADRAATVFNWSKEGEGARPADRPAEGVGLHLLYAGNLGRMQDIPTILAALEQVRDLPGLRVSIAGSGVLDAEIRQAVIDLDLDFVELRGRLTPDEMTALYGECDFQFVTLKDLEIFDGTIPSKFQAGIAHGVPAISTVRGDLRQLIDENQLGFTADPENADTLADTIRSAHATDAKSRSTLRARARDYYEAMMSKQSAIDAIESLIIAAHDSRAT